ncbi:hypothetical protein KDA00_00060 [Candidatus Saccharibacteria bacterium]|nr:hypothetical protein [Candidatus Saccharibacteria bacterium]
MGAFIEINDTLRINKEQGFPQELDLKTHLKTPYKLDSISGKVYKFKSKPDIRIYKVPPVRNFLVEDIDGKWIYWGLCYIRSIEHDYIKKETSGTFEIIRLNTPEEMKEMFKLTHYINKEQNYFSEE